MIYYILVQAALFAEEDGISVGEIANYFKSAQMKPLGTNAIYKIIGEIPAEFLKVEKKGRTNFYMADLSALELL